MLRKILLPILAHEPASKPERLSHTHPYRTNYEAVAYIMQRSNRERSQFFASLLGK